MSSVYTLEYLKRLVSYSPDFVSTKSIQTVSVTAIYSTEQLHALILFYRGSCSLLALLKTGLNNPRRATAKTRYFAGPKRIRQKITRCAPDTGEATKQKTSPAPLAPLPVAATVPVPVPASTFTSAQSTRRPSMNDDVEDVAPQEILLAYAAVDSEKRKLAASNARLATDLEQAEGALFSVRSQHDALRRQAQGLKDSNTRLASALSRARDAKIVLHEYIVSLFKKIASVQKSLQAEQQRCGELSTQLAEQQVQEQPTRDEDGIISVWRACIDELRERRDTQENLHPASPEDKVKALQESLQILVEAKELVECLSDYVSCLQDGQEARASPLVPSGSGASRHSSMYSSASFDADAEQQPELDTSGLTEDSDAYPLTMDRSTSRGMLEVVTMDALPPSPLLCSSPVATPPSPPCTSTQHITYPPPSQAGPAPRMVRRASRAVIHDGKDGLSDPESEPGIYNRSAWSRVSVRDWRALLL